MENEMNNSRVNSTQICQNSSMHDGSVPTRPQFQQFVYGAPGGYLNPYGMSTGGQKLGSTGDIRMGSGAQMMQSMNMRDFGSGVNLECDMPGVNLGGIGPVRGGSMVQRGGVMYAVRQQRSMPYPNPQQYMQNKRAQLINGQQAPEVPFGSQQYYNPALQPYSNQWSNAALRPGVQYSSPYGLQSRQNSVYGGMNGQMACTGRPNLPSVEFGQQFGQICDVQHSTYNQHSPIRGNLTPPMTPGLPGYPSPNNGVVQMETKPPIVNTATQNPVENNNGVMVKGDLDELRLTFSVRGGIVLAPFRLEHNLAVSNHVFRLSESVYKTLMWRSDFELQLKCFHHDDRFMRSNWPINLLISVNSKMLNLDRGDNSKPHKPLCLKNFCLPGQNILQISVSACCCSHLFILQLVHRPTLKSVIQGLLRKRLLPSEHCISKIKRSFSTNVSDNGCSQQTSAKLSLLCPISHQRINLPVRDHACRHIQCFDLESYLKLNCEHESWTCPLCGKPAELEGLEIDQYMWRILYELTKTDAEEIVIDAAANWKILPVTIIKQKESGKSTDRGGTMESNQSPNPNLSTNGTSDYLGSLTQMRDNIVPNKSLNGINHPSSQLGGRIKIQPTTLPDASRMNHLPLTPRSGNSEQNLSPMDKKIVNNYSSLDTQSANVSGAFEGPKISPNPSTTLLETIKYPSCTPVEGQTYHPSDPVKIPLNHSFSHLDGVTNQQSRTPMGGQIINNYHISLDRQVNHFIPLNAEVNPHSRQIMAERLGYHATSPDGSAALEGSERIRQLSCGPGTPGSFVGPPTPASSGSLHRGRNSIDNCASVPNASSSENTTSNWFPNSSDIRSCSTGSSTQDLPSSGHISIYSSNSSTNCFPNCGDANVSNNSANSFPNNYSANWFPNSLDNSNCFNNCNTNVFPNDSNFSGDKLGKECNYSTNSNSLLTDVNNCSKNFNTNVFPNSNDFCGDKYGMECNCSNNNSNSISTDINNCPKCYNANVFPIDSKNCTAGNARGIESRPNCNSSSSASSTTQRTRSNSNNSNSSNNNNYNTIKSEQMRLQHDTIDKSKEQELEHGTIDKSKSREQGLQYDIINPTSSQSSGVQSSGDNFDRPLSLDSSFTAGDSPSEDTYDILSDSIEDASELLSYLGPAENENNASDDLLSFLL